MAGKARPPHVKPMLWSVAFVVVSLHRALDTAVKTVLAGLTKQPLLLERGGDHLPCLDLGRVLVRSLVGSVLELALLPAGLEVRIIRWLKGHGTSPVLFFSAFRSTRA